MARKNNPKKQDEGKVDAKQQAKEPARKEPAKPILDQKLKEKADGKVRKDDWIRASMMMEVLAITEQAARSALEKHIDSLGKLNSVMLYKREVGEAIRVENPLPGRPHITEAYSIVAEIECAVQRYEDLFSIVMNFGPSSIEILEPTRLGIDIGEAQGILNSLADLIHKFVAAGVGGIVIKT